MQVLKKYESKQVHFFFWNQFLQVNSSQPKNYMLSLSYPNSFNNYCMAANWGESQLFMIDFCLLFDLELSQVSLLGNAHPPNFWTQPLWGRCHDICSNNTLCTTPWPYLTFIVGTLVQSSQCRHQILVYSAVCLFPNGPECWCNVRILPTLVW